MGINDRDYYRQVTRNSLLNTGYAPVCNWIIAANVAVFLLQHIFLGTTGWLELSTDAVLHGQVWRLVTYAFCHSLSSIWHILFNMLWLWMLGREVEALYGSREFLAFYLTAALISGIVNVALAVALGDPHPAVGASGAVMAVTMVYALYYPTRVIIVYIFPVQVRWLVLFYVIQDLWPVLQSLAGTGHSDGTAHAAHLGGLAYGFLYKTYDLRFGNWFGGGWNLARTVRDVSRRRSVRIYNPEESAGSDGSRQQLNEQVDEILAKISTHGEASLTDREREILKEASRRFKQR